MRVTATRGRGGGETRRRRSRRREHSPDAVPRWRRRWRLQRAAPSLRSPSPLPEALLPETLEPRGQAAANPGEGLWLERGFPGSADCRGRKEVRAEGQVSPARAGSARLAASELGRNSDQRPRARCGARVVAGGGLGPRSVQLLSRAPAALCPPPGGGSEAPRSDCGLRSWCPRDDPRLPATGMLPSHSSWCFLPLLGISLARLASDGLCAQRYFSHHWDSGRLPSPFLRWRFRQSLRDSSWAQFSAPLDFYLPACFRE